MSGELVTLDGTASMGSLLEYIWTAPKDITLDVSFSATPYFMAPLVEQVRVYSFALVVSNGQVSSVADTVRITVRPKPESMADTLDRKGWQVIYASSMAIPSSMVHVIDNDPATDWCEGWIDETTDYPFEMYVDLGAEAEVAEVIYQSRQAGEPAGTVKGYEVYMSNDTSNWGTAAKVGELKWPALAEDQSNWNVLGTPRFIHFDAPASGRYIRFVATSAVAPAFKQACMAEFYALGVYLDTVIVGTAPLLTEDFMHVYPNPTGGELNFDSNVKVKDFSAFTVMGQLAMRVQVIGNRVDLSGLQPGIYSVVIRTATAEVFRHQIVRK